jgi:hypothetical protein
MLTTAALAPRTSFDARIASSGEKDHKPNKAPPPLASVSGCAIALIKLRLDLWKASTRRSLEQQWNRSTVARVSRGT